GREAEALERYRAATDLAADHLPAQMSRLEAALRAGAYADACLAAESLARSARSTPHRIDWNLCAAVLAGLHLGDLEQARAGYERVLTLDAANPGAFGRLCRILERSEKWAELAAHLEARMAHESEGFRVVELHLALADIFSARLADPTRARLHLAE